MQIVHHRFLYWGALEQLQVSGHARLRVRTRVLAHFESRHGDRATVHWTRRVRGQR